MIRYFKADLYRILRRIPRYIIIGVIIAASGFILYKMADGETPYSLIETFTKFVSVICPIFAVIEFSPVFADDFKAKTMQVAIGSGINRNKVILLKWIELVLLTFTDTVFLLLAAFIAARLGGVVFSGEPLKDVLIMSAFSILQVTGAVGATLIVLFFSLNQTLGIVVLIIMCTGVVDSILDALLSSVTEIAGLHLSQLLFTNLVSTAKTRAVLGTFSVLHILGIVIYYVIFFFAASALYRKKELEF